MPIVLATRNCDQCSSKERCKGQKNTSEISSWPENMTLSGKEKREITKTTERKATVTTWKTAPSVMENMMVGLGTDLPRY